VTASFAGDSSYLPSSTLYAASSGAADLTVAKAGQTILVTKPAPASATAGSTFDVAATGGGSGNPVAFSSDGACTNSGGTFTMTSGTGVCTVKFDQDGNANYDPAPQVVETVNGEKANQTITFVPLPGRTYGDADFTVSASASSGLDVSFDASGDCTVTGATVHLTGAGSCTITASQAGNADFNPAPSVLQTFAIAKAAQTITFAPLPDRTYGDADFAVSASADSGLAVSFAGSGNCTVIGTVVHITGAGSCTVTASQGGDANYQPAAEVPRTFSIAKADQTITFDPIAGKTYGDADFAVPATASSGLVVTLAASGSCTVSGLTAHITAAGSCTITASQAGNANVNPAPSRMQTFSIGRAGTTTSVALVPVAPNPTAQFSDTVELRATVAALPTSTADGVFSGTVALTLAGSSVGSFPVSNASPSASVSVALDAAKLPAGATSLPLAAAFVPAAGGNYAGSASGTQQGVVKPEGENADDTTDGSTALESTGDSYVTVGAAPNLVATLSQSLAPEAGDREYVDYSKSSVSVVFDLYPASCGVPCASPPTWTSGNVRVANRGDWSTTGAGFAQVTAPATLPENSYVLVIRLVPNGYIAADAANDTLDVAATSGTFVTGGGAVSPDSTSNAGDRKGHFSFDVKAKGKGNQLQGSVVYTYRLRMDVAASTPAGIVKCTTPSQTCRDVDVVVDSGKLTSLATGSSSSYPLGASATGQASVQFVDVERPRTHYPQLELADGTFRLDLTDTGNGGRSDRLGLSVYRKDGTLFHAASTGPIAQTGTGAAANQAVIGEGNVTVHVR
jgi:hypothetical protein